MVLNNVVYVRAAQVVMVMLIVLWQVEEEERKSLSLFKKQNVNKLTYKTFINKIFWTPFNVT
jgi:hypothetical protein